jgi:hypothetical protein
MRMRIGVLAAQTARAIHRRPSEMTEGAANAGRRVKAVARRLAAHGRDAALRILQNTA